MTNFFIDPSILAFPPEDEDREEDIKKLHTFYDDLMLLRLYKNNPVKKPDVAFFMKKFLEKEVAEKGYDFTARNHEKRIEQMRSHCPYEPKDIKNNLIRCFSSFFGHYQIGMKFIQFKINNNVQPENSDEGHSYEHYLKQPYFKNEHEKLYDYASKLEAEYRINKWTILARGSVPKRMIEKFQCIKQFDEESKKQKYKGFSTLKYSFENAAEYFASNLLFGDDIKNDIIFRDTRYNTNNIPDRLFYYLEILNSVAIYLKKAPPDYRTGEKLNDIVKIYGGDSILDRGWYEEKSCRNRKWEVNGKPMLFLYHLRPFTHLSVNGNGLTMRVYYKWDNESQKIIIGRVCKHAQNCENCQRKDECPPLRTNSG